MSDYMSCSTKKDCLRFHVRGDQFLFNNIPRATNTEGRNTSLRNCLEKNQESRIKNQESRNLLYPSETYKQICAF